MGIDRTDEFRAILQELYSKDGTVGPFGRTGAIQASNSELYAASADIGAGIHQVSVKVQELRRKAKSKGIFDDKSPEIHELTASAKQDLERLDRQVEALERNAKGSGPNASARAHSTTIVDTLKTRLLEVTKDFKDALEDRTKALVKQDERRRMYHYGRSMQGNSFGKSSRSAGDQDDIEGGMQAATLVYTQNRSDALQNVQRTIAELAQMFQKVATLVTVQGEQIRRIDDDVDVTQKHIEDGQGELLKFYRSVSPNRWLIIKVFLIIIFFVVFFVVFLA